MRLASRWILLALAFSAPGLPLATDAGEPLARPLVAVATVPYTGPCMIDQGDYSE